LEENTGSQWLSIVLGMTLFAGVAPTAAERSTTRPGDALVAAADVAPDRAFTLPGPPEVGDVVPDYGGKTATFDVAELAPARWIVYRSTRGRTNLSWAITLEPIS
jgi:hypothetical protein